MVKVITVHGTFAGDEADEGQKWWQRGSTFLTELQSLLADQIVVEPFHWSGKNSEIDRRSFARKLEKKLRSEKEPPILIGHSHGASLSVHALAHAVLKSGDAAAQRIRGFAAVGMPFILFKGNRNPFTRLNALGRLLLLVGFGIIMTALAGVLAQGDALRTSQRALSDGVSGFMITLLWTALPIFILVFLFLWRSIRRSQLLHSDRLRRLFGKKTFGFVHTQDEAVNALSRGVDITPAIVKWRGLFVGIFSWLTFLSLLIVLSSQAINASMPYRGWLSLVQYGSIDRPAAPKANKDVFISISDGFLTYRPIPDRPLSRSEKFRTTHVSTLYPLAVMPFHGVFEQAELRSAIDSSSLKWPHEYESHMSSDEWFMVGRAEDMSLLQKQYAEMLIAAIAYTEKNCSTFEELEPFSFDLDSYEQWRDQCVVFELVRDRQPDAFQILHSGLRGMSIQFNPPPAFMVRSEGGVVGDMLRAGEVPAGTMFYTFTEYVKRSECSNQESVYHGSLICQFSYWFYLEKDQAFTISASLFDRAVDIFNLSLYPFPESWKDAFAGYHHSLWISVVGYVAALAFFVVGPLLAAAVVSAILAALAKPVLSDFLTNTIRGQAYGNDGYGERIVKVSSPLQPEGAPRPILPEKVDQEILDNSLREAPEAISRLRALLATGEVNADQGVDALKLAVKFDGSELIHNAYFHSPLFIRYVAAVMVVRFGLQPSRKFDADDDALAFASMLRDNTSA